MIFLLGGVSLGLSSCGGEEDATTDAVEEVTDEAGDTHEESH